jgi:hypothetical protein
MSRNNSTGRAQRAAGRRQRHKITAEKREDQAQQQQHKWQRWAGQRHNNNSSTVGGGGTKDGAVDNNDGEWLVSRILSDGELKRREDQALVDAFDLWKAEVHGKS